MRILIALYVILLSMQACSQQSRSDTFIAKVINDFSRNSYFIVLNVKLSDGVAASTIENDDLFYYFNKTKGYDKSKYKSEIDLLIKGNKQLNITDSDFLTFGFTKVVESSKINEDAKKGKDFVLSKYFKNRVIIDGVTKDEKNILIRLLFDWSIPSRIDDESGYLVVETK